MTASKPSAKTKPLGLTGYISNPFTVFINSFKLLFKLNANTFLGLFIVTMTSVLLTSSLVLGGVSGQLSVPVRLGLILLGALGAVWIVILLAALTYYSLATVRGQSVKLVTVIKLGYQKAAGYFALVILVSVLTIIGLVALIIPGLLFIYWFIFAPYIYLDQDVGVIQALRASRKLVRAQGGEVLGLLGAGGLLAIPSIVPLLGLIYQIVFYGGWYVAWAYRYDSGTKLLTSAAKKPSTDRVNYWAIALGLILVGLVLAGSIAAAITAKR